MCVSVCVCVCMCVCVYVPPTVHISSLFAHLSHFIMKKSRIPQTYHVDVDTFDIWGMEIYIRILSRTLYAGTWRDLWTFYLERDRTFGPFIWNVTGLLDLLSGTWQDLWTFYLESDRTFGPFIWNVRGPLDLLSGTWHDLWTKKPKDGTLGWG